MGARRDPEPRSTSVQPSREMSHTRQGWSSVPTSETATMEAFG
jgi:hypothetical protein